MSRSVKIVTLGCSKNTVDSEKLLRQLQHSGYRIDQDGRQVKADIVIVNTCGFINDAREESIDTILELTDARERGDIGQLFVMGCLFERYREDLLKEIPEVDRYFGVNKPDEILRYLQSSYNASLNIDRILTGPGHYAYLKVSEGCNRQCSFCAIPGIRGRYRSAALEDLVEEARILSSGGVRELILIAQDLTYYGIDRYRKPVISRLCGEILSESDIEWLRLHYLYPGSIPSDLFPMMKSSPEICKYVDIPIQHITDRMLSAMKRNHSEYETKKVLSYIRDYMPEAAIRTTVITGFPGETDNDFRALLDFISDFRFERLGVFTYSHEEGTPVHGSSTDDIPEKVKRERADHIMAVQQEISLQKNLSMVGKELRVLIDREEGGYLIARSEFDSPEIDQEILIKQCGNEVPAGTFRKVRIRAASEFDMEAILLQP